MTHPGRRRDTDISESAPHDIDTNAPPGTRHRTSQALASLHSATGAEAFPAEGIAALHKGGLLLAPFPSEHGGTGLACGRPAELLDVLRTIGQADLALGRLYEGHVNAVALATLYGSASNLDRLKDEALAGRISGVWMAGEPLRLVSDDGGRFILHGRKILCSGCGTIRRPLVAAEFDGGSMMLLPLVDAPERIDLSAWTVRGMVGSSTGTVDFDGIRVGPEDLVGHAGDYLRSPFFRGGAWRVLAVQLGGIDAILALYRAQLRASAQSDQPVQLARFGAALIAAETARLWVERAAHVAEGPFQDAASVDATVDLARNAFEAAALEVVACAEKAIGLKAFTRPNPLERVIRDLQTYLRQPALDASLLSAAQFHLAAGT